jgi:UDP:flavonoid glycosyltransferase YjiC (YdhE family)
MAKYLFTTQSSDDLGLLTRTLPVARELAQRGHVVAFSNSAAAPRKLIAEAGFENLPQKHPFHYLNHLQAKGELNLRGIKSIRHDFGGVFRFMRQMIRSIPTRFETPSPQMWSLDHMLAIIGMQTVNAVRVECDSILAMIQEYAPDVIVDSWNPFACLAARAAHKPLVTLIQADMHPQNRGFIWWKDPPEDLPSAAPAFSAVLAGYGLPPIRKVEELCLGNLTLVMGLPETDPLPDSAAGMHVGAILWQGKNAQLPAWFDTLRSDQPVVWIYSGNPRYLPIPNPLDGESILRDCIHALRGEDLQVILTTGHHHLPTRLLPLPANFRYESYVPGLAMAERCDLMIHHGGFGSCQMGLYSGRPMVIIPTFSERESNARRVASAGAGEFLLPGGTPFGPLTGNWGVQADELRAKVRQVLSVPAYRENAARISKRLHEYGGASFAADQIENLKLHQ